MPIPDEIKQFVEELKGVENKEAITSYAFFKKIKKLEKLSKAFAKLKLLKNWQNVILPIFKKPKLGAGYYIQLIEELGKEENYAPKSKKSKKSKSSKLSNNSTDNNGKFTDDRDIKRDELTDDKEIKNDSIESKVDFSLKAENKDLMPNEIEALAGLCIENKELFEVLVQASLVEFGIGCKRGKFFINIGPLMLTLSRGSRIERARQIESLKKFLTSDNYYQLMFGWCVGNSKHEHPGMLKSILSAVRPIVGMRQISIHTAKHQAENNPEIIVKYFGEEISHQRKEIERKRRLQDVVNYMSQAEKENVPLDKMISDTDKQKEAKKKHVQQFSKEMVKIFNDMSTEKGFEKLREILSRRIPKYRAFLKSVITNKGSGNARDELSTNHDQLVEQVKRFYSNRVKIRQAELVLHSMDVLEGTYADCFKLEDIPKGRGVKSTKERDEKLKKLVGDVTPEDVFKKGFYNKLFKAVLDENSADYMASQEYEFDKFSDTTPIIYVYTGEVGPFLNEKVQDDNRVLSLIGEPSPYVAGISVKSILKRLQEQIHKEEDEDVGAVSLLDRSLPGSYDEQCDYKVVTTSEELFASVEFGGIPVKDQRFHYRGVDYKVVQVIDGTEFNVGDEVAVFYNRLVDEMELIE